MPQEGREVTDRNKVWNVSPPPPPAACQEGIILDYPAMSSRPKREAAAWERDPLPGPLVESPRRAGLASLGSSATTSPAAQTGWGRGGRGCVTLGSEKAPGQSQWGLLSEAGGRGGVLWAGRALALSKAPGWRTPFTPRSPHSRASRPPPEPGSETHLGRVTHTPYFRGDREQVVV